MISYIQSSQVIKSFADAHWQIKKFGVEFKEQMPNIATITEQYPILFMCPIASIAGLNTNEFEVDIYCLDRLMQDRDNTNSVISDTHLILMDLARWLEEGQEELEVVKAYAATPINNDLLDYCSGWVMRIRFEVERIGLCEIPMDDIDPTPDADCDPVTYVIYDTDSNVLYSGEVASGGTLTQTIQDSTVTIKNTANTTIHTVTLLAEQTGSQTIADTTVSNSDDTYTASVLAEGSLELPDVTVSNSDDSYSVSSPSVKNIEIPDTPVTNGLNYNVSQPSATQLLLPETDINVNTIEYGSVTSIEDVDIVLTDGTNPVVPTSVDVTDNTVTIQMPVTTQRKSAKLIKTGQTTSFRTGDDGDFERGRLTDFFTLVAVPVNDNGSATVNTTTNRFTSELGTQTYTNNIVIDWSTFDGSTVLGYYRIVSGSNIDWNAAIDAALAHSVGTFTTGWSLWNRRECENLLYEGVSASTYLNYAPFNITADVNIWTSTTAKLVTTTARFLGSTGNGNIGALTKTVAAARWVAVRNFNVVGATLT